VSEEQKVAYLHSSDLFCAPSPFGESFGIVLLEAMATGLVTVAGNNPGYRSVLTGLGSLSLVNPKETEEFAHRMELLLHENDLRKLWRAWAKEQVGQYDVKVIIDQYEELYAQTIKKRKRHHHHLLKR
jgi:glycosyltransferase involved in cell wall biosynthesis